jgi:regulation of enolase protein 1 (concanavalin A-like superfamily)
MATPKRARATSSTPRSKKSAAIPAQENGNGHAALQQTHSNGNVEEAIRVRAYQLFEQRGRVHGYDVEDWVRAKTEISTGAQTSA